MLASDKTHLSTYLGDKNMHPVYISIGNIQKGVCNKPSQQAWMLLAKLPTHKFAALKARLDVRNTEKNAMPGILQKRLFHRAMGVVLAPLQNLEATTAIDASGYEREVVAVLVAWLADLEEQWMILGLAKFSCPKCMARYEDLDTPHPQAPRTGQSIVDDLRAIREEFPDADVWQFVRKAVAEGYVGVETLCWEGLPVDMCRIVCVDALHGIHKLFGNHLLSWVSNAVGENELDLRFMAQPRRMGFRNFDSGISHLSQCSGREHRDLERHLLPVIAGAEDLDPRVLKCVRAFLDFVFKALLPLQSDNTLACMESDLKTFWATIKVFIDIDARTGSSGDTISHFKIPKLHVLWHYLQNIRDLGTPDNYSTEIGETLHIPFCKKAYKATNRKEYDEQIITYLIRREALICYTAYYAWRHQEYPEHENDEYNFDDDAANDTAVASTRLRAFQQAQQARRREVPGADETASPCPFYFLASRPHLQAKSIDNLMLKFEIPDLHSAITLYANHQFSGAFPHRDDYQQHHLPMPFEVLNVWCHVHFARPPLNKFYLDELRLLRCKHSNDAGRLTFDPILVEVAT